MSATTAPRLELASRSPRRAELLRLLGVDFTVVDVSVDESERPGELPAAYVERVARAKAGQVVNSTLPGRAILAADTTVSIDGRIFGKPADAAAASAMLRALSGRRHAVHTAVVVALDQRIACTCVATAVEFAVLDDALIAAYCASGEPYDKAGGYGIQGLGGALVRRIEGSYSAVVGLPLCETRELLARFGIDGALTR